MDWKKETNTENLTWLCQKARKNTRDPAAKNRAEPLPDTIRKNELTTHARPKRKALKGSNQKEAQETPWQRLWQRFFGEDTRAGATEAQSRRTGLHSSLQTTVQQGDNSPREEPTQHGRQSPLTTHLGSNSSNSTKSPIQNGQTTWRGLL